jgi:LytR cell envelope-related transcriptional attenuator
MALPSAVTLASVGVVAVAAVGLVAMSRSDGPDRPTSDHRPASVTTSTTLVPSTSVPSSTLKTRSAKPTKRPARIAAKPELAVMVFNNSGIPGLAAQTAARLRTVGWTVAGVDNWYGDIPSTTVYFPKNDKTQASKLARLLHTTRVRPSVAPMRLDRLTVILVNR